MKRERVKFLVTVSIGYETRADRREALKTAKEDMTDVSTLGSNCRSRVVRAVLVKRSQP